VQRRRNGTVQAPPPRSRGPGRCGSRRRQQLTARAETAGVCTTHRPIESSAGPRCLNGAPCGGALGLGGAASTRACNDSRGMPERDVFVRRTRRNASGWRSELCNGEVAMFASRVHITVVVFWQGESDCLRPRTYVRVSFPSHRRGLASPLCAAGAPPRLRELEPLLPYHDPEVPDRSCDVTWVRAAQARALRGCRAVPASEPWTSDAKGKSTLLPRTKWAAARYRDAPPGLRRQGRAAIGPHSWAAHTERRPQRHRALRCKNAARAQRELAHCAVHRVRNVLHREPLPDADQQGAWARAPFAIRGATVVVTSAY
jgi:hypothetical protein